MTKISNSSAIINISANDEFDNNQGKAGDQPIAIDNNGNPNKLPQGDLMKDLTIESNPQVQTNSIRTIGESNISMVNNPASDRIIPTNNTEPKPDQTIKDKPQDEDPTNQNPMKPPKGP